MAARLAEQVYAPVGLEDDPHSYSVGPSLSAVRNNVVFLLRDGASLEEAAGYLQRYLRVPPERAQRRLARVTRPLRDTYALTYTTGQRLVGNWLRGDERTARFQRLLHGQLLPDDLA